MPRTAATAAMSLDDAVKSATTMLTLLLLSLTFASLSGASYHHVPSGWQLVSKEANVDDAATMKLRVVLHQKTPDALEQALLQISSPNSPTFRQYLTHSDIRHHVQPVPGAVEQVKKWAAETFHSKVLVEDSLHGDFVFIIAKPSEVASTFGVDVQPYKMVSKHQHGPVFRALGQSLNPTTVVPHTLRKIVKAIIGVVDLDPVPTRKDSRRQNVQGEFKGIDISPPIIYKQYNMTSLDVGGKSNISQVVAAFEDAEFKPEDVAAFQAAYNISRIAFEVIGPNNGGYFGEASLDTQYLPVTGQGVRSIFLSQEAFDMTSWCEKAMNITPVPSVLSISWGGGESGYAVESQITANACFQKIGSMGTSVFAASGDDGTGKQGLFCKKFDPTWPASSPWVTAVGATYIDNTYVENGWDYSGGGFSAIWGAPSYQTSATQQYLQTQAANLPDGKLFNASGRATPDISAVGTNYKLYSGGAPSGTLSGTSAATPTVAGMVSVINDQLVAVGKPTVGFINPVLYQAKSIGFDPVTGNNKDGGCPAGFPATTGWDPITGIGTPIFESLRTVLTTSQND